MDTSGIVFGIHAARHALQHSPDSILEIWVQENKKDARNIQQLLDSTGTITVHFVNKQTLDRLAGYQRHQGIVLRRKMEKASGQQDLIDRLQEFAAEQAMILALDGVQDPHNLGACLRTADAAGVCAVVLPKNKAVSVNATVSKVAAGAAENVPVYEVTNLARTLRQLQEAGFWVIGTCDDAPESIYVADLNRPLVLVLGAEGSGLRHNTRKQCDTLVRIPMHGIVESLNISVACGICLYEALRQRSGSASLNR